MLQMVKWQMFTIKIIGGERIILIEKCCATRMKKIPMWRRYEVVSFQYIITGSILMGLVPFHFQRDLENGLAVWKKNYAFWTVEIFFPIA